MKKILSSNFIKSTFQLAMGSILAQLITIACSPLITRLFSVEDMGTYALLLTISSIFGSVINGKFDYAIVSTEDEDDVYSLIGTSVLVDIVFSILVTIGLTIYIFFNRQIWESLGGWIYLSILLLFVTGLANTLVSYNNRMKEYKLISEVYVIRTSIQNFLLVISGFLSLSAISMLLSQFIGSLFGLKKQSKSLQKDSNATVQNIFNIRKIRKTILKYKQFPIYSVPANLVNNLSYSILNFFISGLFGLKILGFYSMTYRILGIPLSLISVNVSKVFFRDAAEEVKEKNNFRSSLKKSTYLLFSMALPMFLILYFFGPLLFKLFFGKEWFVAGEYAKILAPMFSIRLIVGALTPAFIVRDKQRLELVFQVMFLLSSICCYFASLVIGFDIVMFLKLYSVLNSVIYILLYIVIFKLSGGEQK